MIATRSMATRGLLSALFCAAQLANAQIPLNELAPQALAPPKAQFFAGTVVELDVQHIKVSRTLAGRPTESRSFAVTSSTKLNKNAIKLRSRVTVRYRHEATGDIALEVQLRPVVRSNKVSTL